MTRTTLVAALAAALLHISSAHALSTGPLDLNTGLQWAYAGTLADGEREGYQAASTADFKQLLSDGNFTFQGASSATLYLQTGGDPAISYPSGQVGNSAIRLTNTSSEDWFSDKPPLGLPITTSSSWAAQQSDSRFSLTLAFLNGSDSELARLSRDWQLSWYDCYITSCPELAGTGRSFKTIVNISDAYRAEWGATDSVFSKLQSQFPTAASQIKLNNLGYLMIKSAVPEPSTGLTLGLGLAALLGATRARRRR